LIILIFIDFKPQVISVPFSIYYHIIPLKKLLVNSRLSLPKDPKTYNIKINESDNSQV
jgi:hypothetical protein